jgi:CubicO group peptidase (beta-lactamase class C family)
MFNKIRKIFKWLLIVLLILFVSANLFILLSGRTYMYKAIACTYLIGQSGPGILDKDYFHSRTVENLEPEPWPMHAYYGKITLTDAQKKDLRKYQTTSFLLFHKDQLLLEEYWEDFDKSTQSNSFSMAKSIVSILIGIAIDEGKIKNEDQLVSDFIPSYKEGERSKLTLKHLLTMSAALDWSESGGNPLSHNAEAYYGSDLNGMIENMQVIGEPGKNYNYQSGATLILGYIIEKATGMKLSDYASEKLWKKIGAENESYWSLDKEDGLEKSYCCFYATSRDFARFGKLYMHDGKWNDHQVVSSEWVKKSITPAKLIDEDGKKELKKYGYCWWMFDYKGHHVYYMRGILGQYVFCLPDMEMIIVRTGHKRGDKDENDFPSDIYLYMDIAIGVNEEIL